MEAKEKSSSPAATAKGTAPSNYKYFSSLPPIFQVSDPQAKDEMKRGRAYDEGNQGEAYNPDYLYGGENYHKALSDVVSYVLRDCAGDGLSALSDDVVKATNALVAWVNLSEPPSNPEAGKIYGRGFRWPRLKSIDPVQAAELVFAQEVIRMVCVKETVDKPTSEGVFAMYDPDEGIYREIGDGQIDLWCQEVVGAVNGNWKKNFVQKLHDMASRRENRVCECDNPSLVFMANGIWDYEERVLREFSHEVVALRKSATRLPDKEPPVPEHTMPDGSKIDFWQLLDSYVPYDGGRDLLVKVAGASLRSYHNWRVMVTFHNTTGHNGKSTFLDCLKSLVGYDGCMTSSLALLAGGGDGGRFGVSNIVGVSLITCEDSDSGAYLKDNSRLKSIISHDAIGVERKNKGMFDYTPHALIVCAANDIPKTRDKGDAWLARNIYVPFTGQFTFKLSGGGVELTATNDANGQVTFSELSFTQAGTYTFTISEVNDGQQGVTYDETERKVTVTVEDDRLGNLIASVNQEELEACVFRNTYTKPEEPAKPTTPATPTKFVPQTGDPIESAPIVVSAVLGVAILAVALIVSKR